MQANASTTHERRVSDFSFSFSFFADRVQAYNAWKYFDEKLQHDPTTFSLGIDPNSIEHDSFYFANQPFHDEPVECAQLNELFWQCWNANKFALPDDMGACYMFEFQSPRFEFIIAKRSEDESIVLHGVRRLDTMKFLDPTVRPSLLCFSCAEFIAGNRVTPQLAKCVESFVRYKRKERRARSVRTRSARKRWICD
jgi:hypothetical protein